MTTVVRPPLQLTADELAAFWAIDCAVEALFVPDDELARAAAEGRVQHAFSTSSMGTAETFWAPGAPRPGEPRDAYAVVPPGRQAEAWDYERWADDRDSDAVLWKPFRAGQHAAIARAATDAALDLVLEEAARHLVAFERTRRTHQPVLLDWLIAGAGLDPARIRDELATTFRGAPTHLVRGIRARWLTRDVAAALAAVTDSYWRMGWQSDRRVRRMELLRFAAVACRPRAGDGE